MATAPSITPRPPQSPRPVLPERPVRRPAPRRAHTFFFWTIFLLFIAALGYIGLLAFTGDTGRLIPGTVVDTHRLAECLVALAAIAAVAGGIVTRHHMK